MLETVLEIVDIKKSNIPGIRVLELKNNQYTVKLEYHEKMELSFKKGESIRLVIVDKETPFDESKGVYCGNAFLYSIKEKGNRILLFSIGGLILRIEASNSMLGRGFEISKEYKFCVEK